MRDNNYFFKKLAAFDGDRYLLKSLAANLDIVAKDPNIKTLQVNLNRLNENLKESLLPRGTKPFWTLKSPTGILEAISTDGVKGSQTSAGIVAFKTKYPQHSMVMDFKQLSDAVKEEALKLRFEALLVKSREPEGITEEEGEELDALDDELYGFNASESPKAQVSNSISEQVKSLTPPTPESPKAQVSDSISEKVKSLTPPTPASQTQSVFDKLPPIGTKGCPMCRGKGLQSDGDGILRCMQCQPKPPQGYLWMRRRGEKWPGTYLIPESQAANYQLAGYKAIPDNAP